MVVWGQSEVDGFKSFVRGKRGSGGRTESRRVTPRFLAEGAGR